MNGGQEISWTSPTNSLKSNKPYQEDEIQDDPDIIPTYHQYGNNE
jgi:hypothetical protein